MNYQQRCRNARAAAEAFEHSIEHLLEVLYGYIEEDSYTIADVRNAIYQTDRALEAIEYECERLNNKNDPPENTNHLYGEDDY